MFRIILLFICLIPLISTDAQPLAFENRGIGGGGALFSPSISPHDANQVFMSCDMTELFYSENGGGNWDFYASDDLTAFQNSRVQFTSDPNILYVLAMTFREEYTFPMQSQDGGQTWNTITDPTGGEALYLFANPNNTQDLLVSTWGQLYYSDNGGSTWNLAYNDSNYNLHVAGVFWDGNAVYLGSNYGLLISSNGGQSFQLDSNPGLPGNTGFSTFGGARADDVLTLYGVGLHEADLYPTVQAWEISGYLAMYKRQMDQGVGSWENIGASLPGNIDFYQVALAGNTPDVAYIAGTDNSNSYPVVYKTTNGGASWSAVFQTQNNQNIETGWSGYQGDEDWWYGEYPLGFTVSWSDANQVALTDFGFIHRSTDGGMNWQQGYVQADDAHPAGASTPKEEIYQGNGLENTSAWWMHWTDPQTIFSAYTDIGGMTSPDGGLHWTFSKVNRTYNSTYQFIESVDGILYAATSSVHDLYQSTYLTDASINGGTGSILYSPDEGNTWNTLHNFGHPVVSMAIDPNDPQTMYAAVVHSSQGGIYKTTNLQDGPGSNWVKLTDPPRTQGHPLSLWVLEDGAVACSFSGRRTGNFTNSSGVFYSTDGGASWEDRSDPDMFYWTKDLVIDPHDPDQNTWYAAVFSGWGGAANDKGGLFRSTDRGQSWTEVLDLFRAESIGISPADPNIAYVGTEDEGLWYTNNLTASQPVFSKLSAYRFLHPLRIFFNPFQPEEVWVTSFGNGMSLGMQEVSTSSVIPSSAKVFPNPADQNCTISWSLDLGSGQNAMLFDLDGRLIDQFPVFQADKSFTLSTKDLSPGSYLARITGDKNTILAKIMVQR